MTQQTWTYLAAFSLVAIFVGFFIRGLGIAYYEKSDPEKRQKLGRVGWGIMVASSVATVGFLVAAG